MKNFFKNSKGSMAVYVTVTILCFMIILVGIFSITASIRKNQLRTLPKIKEAYEQDLDNIDEIYEEQESIRNLEGGNFNTLKGVNTPDLANGALTPIVWDETANNGQGAWKQTTKDDVNWYNYNVTNKQWANAVINGTFNNDGTLNEDATGYSMFVWIPRFAYQISNNYHNGGSGVSGTINIKFMKGTTNEAADGTTTWDNSSGEGNWNIHPAFQYNGTKTGMWVAKFEASHTGCTTDVSTGQTDTNTATELTLQVKAGVTSWRYIQISNIFDVCKNYRSDLGSHLIKNSEWGAISYLSKSSYGINGEITINNSSSYITGSAGESVSAGSDAGTTNDYTSSQGVKASTTGTIYGIYDMSGGAWEYVSAYINNSNANLNTYGSSLISETRSYMKDIYNKGNKDTREENYIANSHVYGDAIYETSSGIYNEEGNSDSQSWYEDYSNFPYSNNLFFHRGGGYSVNSGAGLFFFSSASGIANNNRGFRLVLILP